MAHYQITLAYDGTHFYGFQRQGSGRTVQAVFEEALRNLGWQATTILSAGRTDSGVHAAGQVVAFDLDWTHGIEALVRALNANLPADIAVKSITISTPDFHPRFDARSRTYRYRIYASQERDPFLEPFAWRVPPGIDRERLDEAAQLLTGTHDFRAFGTPPKPGGNTIRTVFGAGWRPEKNGLVFEVVGNAFLYHMVRRMVFLQVRVGQNRLDLSDLQKAIQEGQPQTPGLAPAHGLTLTEVRYELTEQEKQVYGADGICWTAFKKDVAGDE